MSIVRLTFKDRGCALWLALTEYAEDCSWVAGKHMAWMLREYAFKDWEAVFAAIDDENGGIMGFCTFLETDYYPENRYSPWISSIFVGEKYRGRRLSGELIEAAAGYAREQGFETVYIPSDIVGLYEKYGFVRIDELVNHGGDVDQIFARNI